jgi:Zn-dependent protease
MLGYFLTLEYLKSMIYIAPAILLAITVHEFAHGYVSYKLGDPTPKRDGRLSLNPLAHLDLWGTICLILFLLLVTGILRIPLNRVNTAVLDGMWNVVKKILKILIFPSYQSGSYI